MTTYVIMCTCGEVKAVHARSHAEAVLIVEKEWNSGSMLRHLRHKHRGERILNEKELRQLVRGKLIPAAA